LDFVLVVLVLLVVPALGDPPAVVAVGGGSVPMGCEMHGVTPTIFGAWRPAYVATNCATALASFPTTTFWGMIAPEKPPFSIAYMTRSIGRSQRTLQVGPAVLRGVRTLVADQRG